MVNLSDLLNFKQIELTGKTYYVDHNGVRHFYKSNVRSKHFSKIIIEKDKFEELSSLNTKEPLEYITFTWVNDYRYDYIIYNLRSRLTRWNGIAPYETSEFNYSTTLSHLPKNQQKVVKTVLYISYEESIDQRGTLILAPNGDVIKEHIQHSLNQPKPKSLF